MKRILLGALCMTVASQINISLFGNGFKASAGILLLPVFAFYIHRYPIFPTAIAAAPLVFLFRGLVYTISESGSWQWAADAPEMMFYFSYGLFLAIWLYKTPLHPFRAFCLLPLFGADFCANCMELATRGVFSLRLLFQIAVVALIRTAMIGGALMALERYGFTVQRREDALRYQRLLLMTSMLRGELVWMRKSAALAERTMNAAYGLYSRLRETACEESAQALTIAKDIHEVKKECLLIVRGVTEALEREASADGMYFSEIWETLRTSLSRAALDAGKQAAFKLKAEGDFYTKRHYELLSIFRNLLNNAVEAAGTSPVTITLSQWESGGEYCFTVEDDCGGIPADQLDKVFLEGYSSKINYATGEINRGLGLSLVRDLVEETLGGAIQLESAGGRTVFTIRIPKSVVEV